MEKHAHTHLIPQEADALLQQRARLHFAAQRRRQRVNLRVGRRARRRLAFRCRFFARQMFRARKVAAGGAADNVGSDRIVSIVGREKIEC
jgi:hypothetical protein